MDEAELLGAVEALTEAVGELSSRLDVQQTLIDRIEEQRKESEKQRKDTEKQRRGLLSTRIALGLVVALVVAGGFLFARQESTIRELRAVQDRTSTEILCPLYEFLALSLKANAPNPSASPEQIELRNAAANAIAAGLTKLGCL